MTVNTKSTKNRRDVHYDNLSDLLQDAEMLAEFSSQGKLKMVGNWTYPQVLGHLARAMNSSIDGFDVKLAWYIRFFGKLFMKNMFLKGPIPAGFQLPKESQASMVAPNDLEVEAALQELRDAITRLENDEKRAPHLVLGQISKEEWNLVHLRHSELHMSFAVPTSVT